jgi:hypothetical protein
MDACRKGRSALSSGRTNARSDAPSIRFGGDGLSGSDRESAQHGDADVRVACQPSSGLKRANDVTLSVPPSPNSPSLNRTKLDHFPRISPAAQPLSTTTPPAPFVILSLSSCSAPSARGASRRIQTPRPRWFPFLCSLFSHSIKAEPCMPTSETQHFAVSGISSPAVLSDATKLRSSLGVDRSLDLPTFAPCSPTCMRKLKEPHVAAAGLPYSSFCSFCRRETDSSLWGWKTVTPSSYNSPSSTSMAVAYIQNPAEEFMLWIGGSE